MTKLHQDISELSDLVDVDFSHAGDYSALTSDTMAVFDRAEKAATSCELERGIHGSVTSGHCTKCLAWWQWWSSTRLGGRKYSPHFIVSAIIIVFFIMQLWASLMESLTVCIEMRNEAVAIWRGTCMQGSMPLLHSLVDCDEIYRVAYGGQLLSRVLYMWVVRITTFLLSALHTTVLTVIGLSSLSMVFVGSVLAFAGFPSSRLRLFFQSDKDKTR